MIIIKEGIQLREDSKSCSRERQASGKNRNKMNWDHDSTLTCCHVSHIKGSRPHVSPRMFFTEGNAGLKMSVLMLNEPNWRPYGL